jgi:hypothetical protein
MDIIEVNDRKTWRKFFELPFRIYENDPAWVPPLLSEQKHLLDTRKNPFFSHCHYKAWLAMDAGQPVGRILAYVDKLYNQAGQMPTGFFGFFESVNLQPVADLLFAAAGQWLQQNSMATMCGPMNFAIGNECGVQLTGFEFPPVIQMNHTPVYYSSLFEKGGFLKEHDLYAYRMTDTEVRRQGELLARLEKVGNRALQTQGVRMREINLKNYKQEVKAITDLYNDCMRSNWGFVSTSFEEMLFSSDSLKQIADTRLIYFAEANGEVVGCSISVPDVNQALKHVKNGKLFPFGLFKLLYYMKKINEFRLIFLCVKQDHRLKGLDALFYYHTMREAVENGYKAAELSWVSEDNMNLIKIIEKLGAVRYKTYRMYKRPCA